MSSVSANILRDKNGAIETPMKYPVRGSSKAFGRVNQVGTPALASGSLNVASIVDTGVAVTQINFTSAFSNNAYATCGAPNAAVTSYTQFQFTTPATGSVSILNSPDTSQSATDGDLSFTCTGDLV